MDYEKPAFYETEGDFTSPATTWVVAVIVIAAEVLNNVANP